MPSYDAIVIGGGHNGLVAATILGRSGRRTVLLEADDVLGGAARTVEFAPGFKVSPVAHLLTHLGTGAVEALHLTRHGLAFSAEDLPTLALDHNGRCLRFHHGEVGGEVDAMDAEAWRKLRNRLDRFAAALRPFLAEVPPRLASREARSNVVLGKLGLAIRRLGRDDMREFLRLMLMNIADVLDEEIADDRIKGAVAFDAIIGTHLGPLSPGSLMTYLYRIAGEVGGRSGAFCLPKGGMGTVVHALTLAARRAGAELRAGAAVTRIAVANGRATGVILADGSTLEGRTIVSAANPRTTLMELVGARELDTDIVRRLENIRMAGNAAKLHLALDALPDFTGVADKAQPARLLIAPSVRAVETAFNPAKYGAFSAEPVMEIVIPTCADPSLAPAGKHVLSAIVHYAPYRLKEGWITGKPKLLEACLATLERYAPGLRTLVLHAELLTPADIESRYRMPGGHWHHGELAIDQMFMLRPFQQVAQYATPIEGLWLAGAGSHPGGNVMGLAGLNAARAIIAAEKRR